MAVAVCCCLLAPGARSQSTVAQEAIAKARALESRGLTDLAAQTWQQVLLAQPNNAEALAGLARAAKKQGNAAQAARLLERLRQLNPKDPQIAVVDATVSNKTRDARRAQAEALAGQRNYAAAMQVYRQLYGDHPPEDAALEYYDTEAATPEGKAHAIAGLRALVKQSPGNRRYAATLGRVLTYDPKTRHEGEAILQLQPQEGDTQGALQQALQWDARKTQPQQGPVGNPAEQAAYAALQANEVDRAEQLFRKLLRQEPNNARGLAGMGFVHMKQADFEQAVTDFEAARQHGLKDRTVETALDTARYWRTMGRASKALDPEQLDHQQAGNGEADHVQAGNVRHGQDQPATDAPADARLDKAIELYRQALAQRPASPEALAGLAGTLLRNRQPADAEEVYARWVKVQPDSVAAWRGLFAATAQGSHPQQTLELSERLPAAVAAALEADPGYLSNLAGVYRSVGSDAEAADLQERAIALLRRQIEAEPGDAAAWQALILAQHLANDDAGAVETLQHMPRPAYEIASRDSGFLPVVAAALQQQGRSGEAAALYRRVLAANPQRGDAWVGLLSSLHQQGKDAQALVELATIPPLVLSGLSTNPDYLLALGSIYAATDHSRWALAALARLRAQNAARHLAGPADVEIQISWLLLRMGEESDLYPTLMALGGRADLTDAQRRQVQTIWAQWSVRRAAQAVAAGDPRRALVILHAAQEALGGNDEVSRALAGGYLTAGDASTSLAIYQSLDLRSTQDYQGAVGAALAGKNFKLAEGWLRVALELYPEDPSVLGLAARFEQARGDNGHARAYWEASLAHSPRTGAADLLARTLHTPIARGQAAGGKGPPAETLAALLGSPVGPTRRTDLLPGEAEKPDDGLGVPPPNYVLPPRAPAEPASRRREQSLQDPVETKRSETGQRELGKVWIDPVGLAPAPVEVRASVDSTMVDPLPLEPVVEVAPAVPAGGDVAPGMDRGGRLTLRYASQEQRTVLASQSPVPSAPTGLSDQQLVDAQLPPLTAHYVPAPPSQALSSRAEAIQGIAAIDGGFTPWVGGMGDVRHRTGQPGFDQLTALEAPFEASTTLGTAARLTFVTTPVFLDAGVADGTSTLNFGSVPLGTIQPQQYADGVANEVQLTAINFAARVGESPFGFLVTNIVGGVRWRPAGGPLTFVFSRDSVKDTQLSYSGLRDPGSATRTFDGKIWGGVVANAGDVQVAHGDALSGFYVGIGGQYITGEHVLTNTRFHGNAGAYWRAFSMPDLGTLVLGANFFGMHYAHNLRYFTYGQGGYFSPEAYFLAAMPVSWTGHYGADLHYNVTGSIGAQSFQENSEAYFPLDAGLQSAFGEQKVPVRSSVGSNYDLQTEVAYRIQEHWYVGGFLDFNNTRDYESQSGGFFVRYLFRPQADSEAGPIGAFPRDGFRPVMMP